MECDYFACHLILKDCKFNAFFFDRVNVLGVKPAGELESAGFTVL